MNQYIYRISIVIVLLLMMLSGCSASQSSDKETEEEHIIDRYKDIPPEVDTTIHYQLPVDTKIGLAGNYGELRPNHFHGGLDFKTDQTTGHPVYSFSDGYIREVSISAYGYGLCLFVEHPALGLTSVYGHLEDFSSKIWAKVRERQVQEELNNADLIFDPDEIPVKRGEIIAQSGNTGSSAGPHVHFELRNIPDDDNYVFYDPQMFFLREIPDTQAPRVSHVYLYPQANEGLANGKTIRQQSLVRGICASKGGQGGTLLQPLTAWGRVGLGLKTCDYMDGQGNTYGVKDVRLYMKNPNGGDAWNLVYHFRQDAFRQSEQRYTNSVTDYPAWVDQRTMIMKAYIEPGNRLQQVDETLGDGIVNFDQEKPYFFRYELRDAHENLTTLEFSVKGVRGSITPAVEAEKGFLVDAADPLMIDSAGCHLWADPGEFYTKGNFLFKVADKATGVRIVNVRKMNKRRKWVNVKQEETYVIPCVSKVYTLGQQEMPMHSWCDLAIEVPDDVEKPQELYLAKIGAIGAVNKSRVESDYNGLGQCVCGRIREAGRYAVRRDTAGPEVSIVRARKVGMQISVSDTESGIRRFKVMIDGHFVPFDMDRTGRYYGSPSLYGITNIGIHTVEITAWDNCGNETRETKQIKF